MTHPFINFWRLYAPQKQFHNRYLACKRLWETMDDKACESILKELEQKRAAQPVPTVNEKNPYFFLIDWQPAQPHWLTPAETGYLMAQHVPLAVCRNPETNRFGVLTKTEAETSGLEVHHFM